MRLRLASKLMITAPKKPTKVANKAILTVDKRVGKYLSNSGYHPQPLSNASLIISIGKSKTFVIPLLKLPALRSFATSTPRIMMNTIDSMKIIV